jgi:hypothetical protein
MSRFKRFSLVSTCAIWPSPIRHLARVAAPLSCSSHQVLPPPSSCGHSTLQAGCRHSVPPPVRPFANRTPLNPALFARPSACAVRPSAGLHSHLDRRCAPALFTPLAADVVCCSSATDVCKSYVHVDSRLLLCSASGHMPLVLTALGLDQTAVQHNPLHWTGNLVY